MEALEHPEKEEESNLMNFFEKICYPTMWFLHLVLPMNLLPELCFLAIVFIFFMSMDFILTVVSVLSIYTSLSHILIALTIISWGACPIELINLIIATKKNELQIGLTAILSAIVMAFYLIIPFAFICKMIRRGSHEIQAISPIHSTHLYFLPALAVTIGTLLIYWKT